MYDDHFFWFCSNTYGTNRYKKLDILLVESMSFIHLHVYKLTQMLVYFFFETRELI